MDNDIVARLKDVDLFGVITLLIDAREEIERLRKELAAMREERDEARRDVCEYTALLNSRASKEDVAAKHGWDCFKEATNDR